MRKFKKITRNLICIIIYLIISRENVFANNFEIENVEVFIDKEPVIMNYELRNPDKRSSFLAKSSLLSNYDLNNNIVVNVRNQLSTGQCWTFTANTALETNLAINNNENLAFSTRHMEYSISRTFLNGEINKRSYKREAGDGGNNMYALSYYTSGMGPILESDMPFEDNKNKIELSEIQNKTVQKKVEDYIFFPNIYKEVNNNSITYKSSQDGETYTAEEVKEIRNTIKEHIVSNGSIMAYTIIDKIDNNNLINYYNPTTYSYYCPDNKDYNHQISIVGWDDNFSKNNFSEENRPLNDGAYIVLNSWGENWGDAGYFYISYDDVWIERSLAGIINVDNIDYDNLYQHDILEPNMTVKYKAEELYGANVFNRDINNKSEYLKEVSVSTLVPLNGYEIYVNSKNGNLTSVDFGNPIKTSTKELAPGYYTITFDEPIKLTGEKFAIAMKYKKYNTHTVITYEAETDEIYDMVESKAGESYIGTDLDHFMDLKEEYFLQYNVKNANILLKAFTKNEKYENIFIEEKYKINEEKKYIYGVYPNTKVSDFLKLLVNKDNVAIIDANENELELTDIVKTGMFLKLNSEKKYQLAVIGDTNGDGKVSITDLARINFYILKKSTFSEIEFLAGDNNFDGKVSITDLARVNFVILKKFNF